MVRIWLTHCWDLGSISGLGTKIPQVSQQPRLPCLVVDLIKRRMTGKWWWRTILGNSGWGVDSKKTGQERLSKRRNEGVQFSSTLFSCRRQVSNLFLLNHKRAFYLPQHEWELQWMFSSVSRDMHSFCQCWHRWGPCLSHQGGLQFKRP